MFGLVTRNAEELDWEEFDRGFFEVKDVSGHQTDPVSTGVNAVSCHGDSIASKDDDLVPVTANGQPATRDRPYFDWGYVCPTHDQYTAGLLQIIEDCASMNEDVRLDDVGFPRAEYCYCDRCTVQYEESDRADRFHWRSDVITAFLERARDRIPGDLYLTLYPDPYPGHLYQRTGIDLERIEELVDQFVIPLYDMSYTTTYWLEIIASSFADRLATPIGVELYAHQVDPERLTHATAVVDAYVSDVYFGYDAGTGRTVIRRLKADEGVTYGDPESVE